MKFYTVSDMIKILSKLEKEYGDIPLIMAVDPDENKVMRPIRGMYDIDILEQETNTRQRSIIISDYDLYNAKNLLKEQ